MLVWWDQRKRDLCESCLGSLLLLSSLICFHLHYLYWLCNPPLLSLVEILMPLLLYPTFSCTPYMTLQGRSVHSTSFQVGSWLSCLNNGCSISTPQLRRETSSGAAQGTHARPRGGCQAAPAQQADELTFWYLKAGKATSHASSPLFEQDLNLLEQIKPKKGNTIEIHFFKNTV